MINHGKKNLLGVLIDAVDYDFAVTSTISAAVDRRRLTVAALAVHGVMTGALNSEHKFRLNNIDLAVPDGQPVRWATNLLYRCHLTDRVYGPRLTHLLCLAASKTGLPVFFYGSKKEVVRQLAIRMAQVCPGLTVAGYKNSAFKTLTTEERLTLIEEIRASGARILFVGLGCPRQEVFAYEMGQHLAMPIVSVGAAFDYYAGNLREPPAFIQRAGLQWLYRLLQEPRGRWRPDQVGNTHIGARFQQQATRFWHPRGAHSTPPQELRYG
jgi:N-acetylglucosaminyldiphosphoundecaprenol N-acetyl-beta-D-mannosaminyltransferase